MRTSKFTLIMLTALFIILMVCVGLAAWVIKTTWQPYDPDFGEPVYISRIVEANYNESGINLGSSDTYKAADGSYQFKFYRKNGDEVIDGEEKVIEPTVTVTTPNVNDKSLEGNLKDGGTYNISGVSVSIKSKYRIVGTVANPNVPESFELLTKSNYIYQGSTTDSTTTYTFTNLIFKYKTVQVGDDWYTIEDALNNAISGQTATVKVNTSFAGADKNIDIGPKIPNQTNKKISVAELAGYSGNNNYYTVKSGVTLLVPYNGTDNGSGSDGNQLSYTTSTSATAQTGYVTLFVSNNLTVNGILKVNALVNIGSTDAHSSSVHGADYGQLDIAKNAEVAFKNAAQFWCIGFASGEGNITIESGATVYELLNLTGWRGGSISLKMATRLTPFPFNQYSVTGIEARTKFEYGSHYKIFASMTLSSRKYENEVLFLSNDTSAFLQLKESSSIVKWIDTTREKGRIHFEIYGKISFNNLSVEITGTQASTNGRQVPIPGNFAIELKKDSDVTISDNVSLKLLPGAQLHIAPKAKLTLQNGASAYSYGGKKVDYTEGKKQWDDGTGKPYPSGNQKDAYRFDAGDLNFYNATTPAKIIVGGQVDVQAGTIFEGDVYGEESEEGNGTLNIKGTVSGQQISEYMSDGTLSVNTYKSTITSCGINADDTYFELNTNTIYTYQNGKWSVSTKTIKYTVIYDYNDGITEHRREEVTVHVPETSTEVTISQVDTPNPVRDFYTFEGWYTEAACENLLSENPLSVKDGDEITVYAKWSPIQYTVKYVISGADGATNTNPATWTVKGGTITLAAATHGNEALEFKGWFSDSQYRNSITEISEANAKDLITGDGEITIYGYFEDAAKEYDYEFSLDSGTTGYTGLTTPNSGTIKLGETLGDKFPTNNDEFTKYDYDVDRQYYFDGWTANGNPIAADTVIDSTYLTDGTLVIKANWKVKVKLTVTVSASGKEGGFLGIGAQKTTAQCTVFVDNKAVKEDLTVTSEENDTVFSKTYVCYLKPGQEFTVQVASSTSWGRTTWYGKITSGGGFDVGNSGYTATGQATEEQTEINITVLNKA